MARCLRRLAAVVHGPMSDSDEEARAPQVVYSFHEAFNQSAVRLTRPAWPGGLCVSLAPDIEEERPASEEQAQSGRETVKRSDTLQQLPLPDTEPVPKRVLPPSALAVQTGTEQARHETGLQSILRTAKRSKPQTHGQARHKSRKQQVKQRPVAHLGIFQPAGHSSARARHTFPTVANASVDEIEDDVPTTFENAAAHGAAHRTDAEAAAPGSGALMRTDGPPVHDMDEGQDAKQRSDIASLLKQCATPHAAAPRKGTKHATLGNLSKAKAHSEAIAAARSRKPALKPGTGTARHDADQVEDDAIDDSIAQSDITPTPAAAVMPSFAPAAAPAQAPARAAGPPASAAMRRASEASPLQAGPSLNAAPQGIAHPAGAATTPVLAGNAGLQIAQPQPMQSHMQSWQGGQLPAAHDTSVSHAVPHAHQAHATANAFAAHGAQPATPSLQGAGQQRQGVAKLLSTLPPQRSAAPQTARSRRSEGTANQLTKRLDAVKVRYCLTLARCKIVSGLCWHLVNEEPATGLDKCAETLIDRLPLTVSLPTVECQPECQQQNVCNLLIEKACLNPMPTAFTRAASCRRGWLSSAQQHSNSRQMLSTAGFTCGAELSCRLCSKAIC